MTKSEVVQCPDHHFRRVLWGLAVYIADYMEQVLVCVQYWCVRCVIDSDFSYTICLIQFRRSQHYRPTLIIGPDRHSRAHTDFLRDV
jgi:hypothetical protein